MKKLDLLRNYIKDLGKVVVAFSGGVDSTFLLAVCKEVLGDNAIAVTINSPYIPKWEIEEAKELTKKLGARHMFVEVQTIPEDIILNPSNKCYLCKSRLFKKIFEVANDLKIDYVLDGTNIDDTKDYRPGLKALDELSVKSPLKELLITKDEIRKFSKELNLPTWDKPAYACLLTRMETNKKVTKEDLNLVEGAERVLHKKGFKAVRVRKHESLARIEVSKEDMIKILDKNILEEISKEIKNLGFKFVTLDLDGYKMGSLNLEKK